MAASAISEVGVIEDSIIPEFGVVTLRANTFVVIAGGITRMTIQTIGEVAMINGDFAPRRNRMAALALIGVVILRSICGVAGCTIR